MPQKLPDMNNLSDTQAQQEFLGSLHRGADQTLTRQGVFTMEFKMHYRNLGNGKVVKFKILLDFSLESL